MLVFICCSTHWWSAAGHHARFMHGHCVWQLITSWSQMGFEGWIGVFWKRRPFLGKHLCPTPLTNHNFIFSLLLMSYLLTHIIIIIIIIIIDSHHSSTHPQHPYPSEDQRKLVSQSSKSTIGKSAFVLFTFIHFLCAFTSGRLSACVYDIQCTYPYTATPSRVLD